ncbi:hypothetical protein BMT55_16000 [Listeria newyorkensis]|uniref:Uncharacterized protein n=1 Tax=Listeria newyorkensis TaxID=1497681 RepID=A0ABX4XK51_9LIST|nr:hypothetical protein EP58_00135 [Listeria newyorkensis]PNP87492.1 hypothetical protein BMT55_16000 [Listeria newyorkensis]SQC56715.1 Uncharacterised protein [Listeria newyorkensis]
MCEGELKKVLRMKNGLHAHCVLMHIEVLNRQVMPHKNHNKAETARLASTECKERMLTLFALVLRL